jgi:hypothetical protein
LTRPARPRLHGNCRIAAQSSTYLCDAIDRGAHRVVEHLRVGI